MNASNRQACVSDGTAGLRTSQTRQTSVCVIIACLLAFSPATWSSTKVNTEEPSATTAVTDKIYRPYCGLYCLYTLIKATSKDFQFTRLLWPEYIGSREGSSLLELRNVAEDHGMYAIPVGNLTSRKLVELRYPTILHVKSDIRSDWYDHYELFLGTRNGQAVLFDPSHPVVRSVPFRELAPRWDGNGLIVSTGPIRLDAAFAPERRRFLAYAAITLAMILAVHWARRQLPETLSNSRARLFWLSTGQGAAFVIGATICGVTYHLAKDEGLLANANATASIQQAHQSNFIPKVSEKRVRRLLDGNAVFIDARLATDFEAGHLKGAINVPVDANDVERQRITAGISKDAHIVLYCQSSGCKFADGVAIRLISDGFNNISIFRGGWYEWTAKNGPGIEPDD